MVGTDHVRVLDARVLDILADGLAVDRACIGMQAAGTFQFMQHRRQPAGAVIFLAEIFAGRLHIDQQRHVIADGFPVP